jgi:hypothetical protein
MYNFGRLHCLGFSMFPQDTPAEAQFYIPGDTTHKEEEEKKNRQQ